MFVEPYNSFLNSFNVIQFMQVMRTAIVAILAILVIVTGVLLFSKQTQAEYQGGSCACTISQLDAYGEPWTVQTQNIRVKLTGRLSDDVCNARCNEMFYSANSVVAGVAN